LLYPLLNSVFLCLFIYMSIGSASIHPLVTVTQNCMDQKSSDSSPNHSQVSRNSSKKSNSSLLVHASMYQHFSLILSLSLSLVLALSLSLSSMQTANQYSNAFQALLKYFHNFHTIFLFRMISQIHWFIALFVVVMCHNIHTKVYVLFILCSIWIWL